MIVRYREFVFPPVPNAEPDVVGCVVEWGWNDKMNRVELGYRFRTWLEPLANYLYRQMQDLNLELDTLEQGLGVYEGRGQWLEVKYKEGLSRGALRRWFTDTYVHSQPAVYVPLQPDDSATVLAVHEEPGDDYSVSKTADVTEV